jgi:hypothetical protein
VGSFMKRCYLASGDTARCASPCVIFAANCASVVLASFQRPKVTKARQILPAMFAAPLPQLVRRAVALRKP